MQKGDNMNKTSKSLYNYKYFVLFRTLLIIIDHLNKDRAWPDYVIWMPLQKKIVGFILGLVKKKTD